MTTEPLSAVADDSSKGERSVLWTVTLVLAILGMAYGLLTVLSQILALAGIDRDGAVWWVIRGFAGPVAYFEGTSLSERGFLIPAFFASVAFGALCVVTVAVGRSSRGEARRWPQIVTGALAGVALLSLGLWKFTTLFPIIHVSEVDTYYIDTSVPTAALVMGLVVDQVSVLVLLAWVVVAIVWATKRRPGNVNAAQGMSSLPVVTAGGGVAVGWYADPDGKPSERFWDGNDWTDRTRPLTATTAAARSAQTVPGGRTNALAIVAFILAFVFPIVGLVLGYVSLSQMKRSREGGHGLALAAVILGWIFTALVVVWVVLVLMATSGSSY